MHAYKLELYGTCVADMQKQFDAYVAQQRPEPNKLQKLLYGSALDSQSDEMVRKIVNEKRGCGNTTAKVLHNIANAIEARGKAVAIEFEVEQTTEPQRRQFRDYMRNVIDKLELKFVEVNAVQNTIKLDI